MSHVLSREPHLASPVRALALTAVCLSVCKYAPLADRSPKKRFRPGGILIALAIARSDPGRKPSTHLSGVVLAFRPLVLLKKIVYLSKLLSSLDGAWRVGAWRPSIDRSTPQSYWLHL